MSMKLLSKTLKMNDDTFAPELEVVIRVPLEQRKEGDVENSGVYEKLGKELASLLEAKNAIH